MDDIIEQLQVLGFTPTEAKVYLTLVREGSQTGYQVAKSLGLSRSSVYAALDSLFSSGAVYLKDGPASEYMAKEPKLLITEKRREYRKNADDLESALSAYRDDGRSSSFYNVGTLPAILDKARELLADAEKEVYINTDFDLEPLAEAFLEASSRGVRILLFSFRDYGTVDLPIEIYQRVPDRTSPCENHRLMLVTDDKKTLVAGGAGQSYRGVFTANPLMARIVAEHIHLDLYILRAGEGFEKLLSEGEILLGTIHEGKLVKKTKD